MSNRIAEQPLRQTRVICRAVDNLELLKSQPDESVDLIYCDILYGTGRNFGDYQDLKPIRSEIEAHYLPRLKEMHRVLKSTGSIYLHMDWRISHWIRCIMDDIFGYKNFINEIIWYYRRWTAASKSFQKMHDTIFWYSKSSNYIFNEIYIDATEGQKHKHEKGWDRNSVYIDGVRKPQLLIYDNDKVNKAIEEGKININEYARVVEIKNKETIAHDVWQVNYLNSQSKERENYPTQKPKALIERIIKASSNEGDTVADYYLGSGTTAVVCKELNRNFIGCDINPKAIEITNARLDAV